MSDVLKLAAERAASKPTAAELRPMGEPVSIGTGDASYRLAVAEVPGDLVLIREREVGKLGKDGKRSRDHGTERVWKRTASLADVGAAIGAGLL